VCVCLCARPCVHSHPISTLKVLADFTIRNVKIRPFGFNCIVCFCLWAPFFERDISSIAWTKLNRYRILADDGKKHVSEKYIYTVTLSRWIVQTTCRLNNTPWSSDCFLLDRLINRYKVCHNVFVCVCVRCMVQSSSMSARKVKGLPLWKRS